MASVNAQDIFARKVLDLELHVVEVKPILECLLSEKRLRRGPILIQ